MNVKCSKLLFKSSARWLIQMESGFLMQDKACFCCVREFTTHPKELAFNSMALQVTCPFPEDVSMQS